MARQILRSNDVMQQVCDALDLPHTKVYRLVLELCAGQPAIVGVEMRPDKDDASAVADGFVTVVDRHYLVKRDDADMPAAAPTEDSE
jgi:hypothetical protein